MLISKFATVEKIEDRIMELETKYDLKLEAKYVKFLTVYNGGETPDTDICIKGKKYDVRGFFGFDCADKMYNFDQILQYDEVEGCIKKKWFPIACNYFGDYFYLIATSSEKNQVVLKYHDSNTVNDITDSFEDMILKGKSKKIGHIRTIEERKNDLIKAGLGYKINDMKIYSWQREIDSYKNIHQELIVL